MEASRLQRIVLCVYEGIRLAFITGAFVVLRPEGGIPFPWLALISAGAMFFLMPLFWLINMPQYRSFCPLYLAGKGLGILTTVIWLFFGKNSTIRELLVENPLPIFSRGISDFLLIGDLLSVWLVISIFVKTFIAQRQEKTE
jgi:hypothetical protein